MSVEVLKCDSISFEYPSKRIIKNVSFALNKGEIGVLLGPSGCGKTTLLRVIAGFENNQKGEILINQKTIKNDSINLPPKIRKVGYVFQDYALFPNLTVEQNILFGLDGVKKSIQQEVLNKMIGLFKLEADSKKYPHQLSGGQQQRVAIARSLAPTPEILLLDEPFSNLDLNMREELIIELKSIFKNLNITALFVTHDIGEACSFADKIGVLNKGELLQWATPSEVFLQPHSIKIAFFLQSGNFLNGEIKNGKIITTFGEIENISIPKNMIDHQKVILFLPHGSVSIHENGQFSAKVIRMNFSGKVYSSSIQVAPDIAFSLITLSDFRKKNTDDCKFNINFEGCICFPLDEN